MDTNENDDLSNDEFIDLMRDTFKPKLRAREFEETFGYVRGTISRWYRSGPGGQRQKPPVSASTRKAMVQWVRRKLKENGHVRDDDASIE